MKRKILVLLVSIMVAFSVLLIIGFPAGADRSMADTDGNSSAPSEPANLKFADNYISYILQKGEVVTFNLFGAQPVSTHETTFLDSVNFISLGNDNIEIVDYEISQGDVFENHQLFNILIDVKIDSDELEKAKELTLHYGQNSAESFSFGEMVLKSDSGYDSEEIDLTGKHTLASPTPSLDLNLSNETSEYIELIRIYDLAENLSFEFADDYRLTAHSTEKVIIEELHESQEHDFYTVTPIVEYLHSGQTSYHHLPGVIFGVMDADDEKMRKILD